MWIVHTGTSMFPLLVGCTSLLLVQSTIGNGLLHLPNSSPKTSEIQIVMNALLFLSQNDIFSLMASCTFFRIVSHISLRCSSSSRSRASHAWCLSTMKASLSYSFVFVFAEAFEISLSLLFLGRYNSHYSSFVLLSSSVIFVFFSIGAFIISCLSFVRGCNNRTYLKLLRLVILLYYIFICVSIVVRQYILV